MSVNSTFVLMLFVIDVPTLNKILSYLIYLPGLIFFLRGGGGSVNS